MIDNIILPLRDLQQSFGIQKVAFYIKLFFKLSMASFKASILAHLTREADLHKSVTPLSHTKRIK
jgi:hypothetical protein